MAAEQHLVLVPNSLDQVYTPASVNNQSKRWTSLIETFTKRYSLRPGFVARAPGRINIIGEHIDYCGFSVLPSAIEPDLLIAGTVQPADQSAANNQSIIRVQAINLNPAYPEVSFDCDPANKIAINNGGWSDYLKSAFNVCLDHVKNTSSNSQTNETPRSIKLLIDGSVPAGSGLSSSAAITTASVLAVLHIFQSDKKVISKSLVASLAIKAEQACGVSVGGMDQTASVFGQPAKLLHIEFTPTTRVVPLELPNKPSTTFIIANSLVTSKKADSSKVQYNLRVVECRIATRIISNELLNNPSTYPKNLRELVATYSSSCNHQSSSVSLAIQLVLDKLNGMQDKLGGIEGLNHQAILDILQINQAQFEDQILSGMIVEPINGLFKPYCRARHVLSEAQRVYKLREFLEHAQDLKDSEEVILRIGQLMNGSQTSCQVDYECSCEELDELVSIARSHGSLGSRLTGAGWGGSSVHLVRDSDIEKVIQAFKSEYYNSSKRFSKELTSQEFSDACFATKPQGGASLFLDLDSILSKSV